MNKVRGCFITVVIMFILVLFAALLFFLFSTGSSRATAGSASNNYLILGVDEREDLKEFKGRTDTIMIYHMAPLGKKDVLISIPRDTRVNLEGRGWNKINAAYVYGGEKMLKDSIYSLTSISINKTIIINFEGFKRIVDVLGGVRITVEEPMHDPLSGSNFDPGTYLMDGEQALAFSRCRKTAGGDFDRVDRQKYLLNELIKQKINISIIAKAPQLITILNEETKTDFTVIDFIKLGTILIFSDKDFERITIPGKTATIDGISYVVSDAKEVKEFLSRYLQ